MALLTPPRIATAALAALAIASCGGGNPATPSPPAANPNQIVIASGGTVSPQEIVVVPGSRVLFVNHDARSHHMASDPHPDHTDCPEINAVGLLNPGQSRETGNLVLARTCGFHDHDNPTAAGLKGRIVIR